MKHSKFRFKPQADILVHDYIEDFFNIFHLGILFQRCQI